MSTNTFVNIQPGHTVTWATGKIPQYWAGVVASKDVAAGTCVIDTFSCGGERINQSVVVELKELTVQTGCTGCGDMSRGGCLVFGSCGGAPGTPP